MGNGKTVESIRIRPSLCIWTAVWVIFLSIRGFPGEPGHLAVSQAYADLPAIIAYVDILDNTGNPVHGITREQISATVGEHPTVVDTLAPFGETNEGL